LSEYVGVCWNVLQCVQVCCGVLQCVGVCCSVLECVGVCWSVLQCVAVPRSVLQCVAVCCGALECVVSVLRRAAVRYEFFRRMTAVDHSKMTTLTTSRRTYGIYNICTYSRMYSSRLSK